MKKVVVFIILYGFMAYNYANGYIGAERNFFLFVSIVYWGLVYILCGGVKKLKAYETSNVSRRVVYGLVPLVAFYISEIIWNVSVFKIPIWKVALNYLILLGIQTVVYLICRNYHAAYYSILFFMYIYGLVNYYVILFKGNPLMPSELAAAGTAMMVVSNYQFTISDTIVKSILLMLAVLCILKYISFNEPKRERKLIIRHAVQGIVCCCVFFGVLIPIKWGKVFGIRIDVWNPLLSYYANGGILTFLVDGQSMMISKPEGYSAKKAQQMLDENTVADTAESEEVTPSVIVIMNESFADFDILGDFESEDYLVNFNSMSDYVMRGNTYVSVKGGGTCNSEFEFLTGCSMGNLSQSVYPYEMYDLSSVYSLPKAFSENGYKTVAIHPKEASNWNRENVYEQLGFDEFISIEDMTDVENIRNYASDQYDYEQVIAAYESTEEPVFIFNITMQNHGGYDDIESLGEIAPLAVEERFRQYSNMVTYLTLIRESDKAFAELIDYFSQKEEPVIICMFGDHLPNLGKTFYEDNFGLDTDVLTDAQRIFCTPYIVWSNFEMDTSNVNMDTSLNYLGNSVMELANISTPYSEFLANMQQEVPVINAKGYQTTDGQWHEFEEENEWIDQYQILQYYLMFDKEE